MRFFETVTKILPAWQTLQNVFGRCHDGLACIILPRRCVFRFRVCVLSVFSGGGFITLVLCVFPACLLFFCVFVNKIVLLFSLRFCCCGFRFTVLLFLCFFICFFFVLCGVGARGILIWCFAFLLSWFCYLCEFFVVANINLTFCLYAFYRFALDVCCARSGVFCRRFCCLFLFRPSRPN